MLESRRLALQQHLDAAKTVAQRNRLGQFATPTALATDMLTYAKSLLTDDTPIRFLDPAIGTGSFYSALRCVFPEERISSALGYEIDPVYGTPARELWRDTNVRLCLDDFTRVAPPTNDEEKATLLICNPPYVRHHHLDKEDKQRLGHASRKTTGHKVSGLAGLYCYFLLLADAWLANDGIAGWLIPSEWMTVNYGSAIKNYLLDNVTLLRVHRFDPHDTQFDDALVSSSVVWFKKAPAPPNHHIEFSVGGTLATPTSHTYVPADVLRATTKWTEVAQISQSGPMAAQGQLCIADFFKVQRGLATGANDFFILNEEQIFDHQIPAQFLTPILPPPRHLHSDEIEADNDGLPIVDRRLFLLTCDLPERVVQDQYPALWRYLQWGVEQGISTRYLSAHRSPWYLQERRPAPLFLCTYMGRQNTRRGRPFRFILNHSLATAANVYLLLYPRQIFARHLRAHPQMVHAIWQALNAMPLDALTRGGRVYGGGLHKLEPRELGNASGDTIRDAVEAFGIELFQQHSLFVS